MTREEFTHFVEETIEQVICLAEQECGKSLPRLYVFRWLGRSQPLITENAIEHIVQRVFVDEKHIFPCVDIGVADLLDDSTLLIVGSVAGFAPRPFGDNWTGRKGPFVHIVGVRLLSRMAGEAVGPSNDDIFAYSIPDMENLKS